MRALSLANAASIVLVLVCACTYCGLGERVGSIESGKPEIERLAMVEKVGVRRILFISNREGTFHLYAMDEDGADLEKLSSGSGDCWEASIFPDGSRVVFSNRYEEDSEVWVMAGEGHALRNLTNSPDTWEMLPCWSPDGRQIALVSVLNNDADVFIVGLDGGQPLRLTESPSWEMQPVWSPGGEQIALASNATGSFEIYLLASDGSAAWQLTRLGAFSEQPIWSPDGETLAFISHSLAGTDLYTVPAGGGSAVNLTRSAGQDVEPCWSPDGRHLAFSSDRDGTFAIYVVSAAGGRPRKLTPEASGNEMQPSWSPDGRQIAFAANYDGQWDIYVANADGSSLRQLTDDPGWDLRPLWLQW